MDPQLKKIRVFAHEAHTGQMRKYTPEPYIVHPEWVMETCSNYSDNIPLLAAALLHDVLEDTSVSPDELFAFLDQVFDREQAIKTYALVVELTDVYTKENFPQWNRKQRKDKELERIALISPDAQTVKYADILDNSRKIADEDPDFAPRYLQESLAILYRIDKGDRNLHNMALEIVQYNLRKLKKS
jgi:(p)ppGpp synthase/HD superfamily hydrolase